MVRWLALGLWYAAIIYTSSLTSAPVSGQPLSDFLIAKFGHVFVYSVLGWVAAEALTAPAAGLALRGRVARLTTIVLGMVLAALDETRQSFVYGRTGQLADVLLDTLAVSGGALLHHWLTGHWLTRRVGRPLAVPGLPAEPPAQPTERPGDEPGQERPPER